MIPNVMTVAGSDPSGGAGIQADIKAISASGGYALAVIAALTVQNTRSVQAARILDADFIAQQIRAVREDIQLHAIKIGMLGNADAVDAVATALADIEVPIVLDPVMVAKSGDRLLAHDAVSALRERLLPLAIVVTPNLPEAADLLGAAEACTREDMVEQARAILQLGPSAVVIKGGHLDDLESPDLLVTRTDELWFPGARTFSRNTHGSGCTFSAALATHLGHGRSIAAAVQATKAYVSNAIEQSHLLSVGAGHGPLNHFPTRSKDIEPQ